MLIKTMLLLCVLSYAAAETILGCRFENDLCKWTNDPNNWKLKWRRRSLDEMGFLEHGNIENGGVCVKSLGDGSEEILTARLWGPEVLQGTKVGCLMFQYRMDGDQQTKLTMMRREMGNCESQKSTETGALKLICTSMPIWVSKNGDDKGGLGNENNNNQWISVNIDLKNSNNDFKLILEGTIPSGNPNAKICVDNITSSAEPCEVPKLDSAKSVPSFHSWVEIFGMTFAGALALGLTIPIAVFVVCLFERKRQRGKKSNRIIRHADELDLPEAMNSASGNETNPMPQRYTNTQVGVGHPRLMGRAMSTPVGTNGQGGSYTMGKRNGPQQGMGPRSTSGQMSHTMGRGTMEGGWMMSSQHGDLMENDEYTIDPDYTTHRQMSVPANGYIPVASNMNQMDQGVQQAMMYQNRPMPQPQASGSSNIAINNNPFGTPVTSSVNVTGQDTRSLAGSHGANFSTDDNRATPALPFYPPRYEEAMGFNQGQVGIMDEKPPLLPPRIPDGSGSSSGGANTSCSTPLPPAPPPLPLSGHPSAGRFMGGNEI